MANIRDQRPYNVKYYARNRQREIDRVLTRQRATLEFLRGLRRVPCKDCGQAFLPHQMDFDHRDPALKSFNIMTGRAMLMKRERLLAEIAKCDVVCANCHALRTYALQAARATQRRADGTLLDTRRALARRGAAISKRDFLFALRDRPCHDCQRHFPPYVMEFDHRDPSTKLFNVAQSWTRSSAGIAEEAAKCDIVCHNCHRERTFRRRPPQAGVT